MARRWIAALLVLAFCGSALAQRKYMTIDPTELDEDLKFDVNLVPVRSGVVESGGTAGSGSTTRDLNFAPNIVFTADSGKGFVSYSGSDKVMAFHPKTGEILDLIEVGNNPSQISVTPDGKFLAVVCLELLRNLPQSGLNFIGEQVAGIALIDVETHAVRSLELQQVWLSFANNILFSADGKTGYVASAATDELIRFNVDTMTEVTPRLKFTPGTRPTSMTMAPDHSFMSVVLVGSTNLNRLEVPDSVAIVDPASFQLVRTIAPKTGPTVTDEPVIHDFTATTIASISPDGKFLMITDQTFSSASVIPELANDRAWLYDFEKGEFVRFTVGGVATGSFWAPNGKVVVMSGLEFAVIDAVAKTANRVVPLRSEFRPRSRPAFSADGERMFMAAPLNDTLIVYNLATNEFRRFVDIGGFFERNEVIFSSAPLQLAFTPDESVLVSANFNANTIDLIRATEQWYIPRAPSDATFFTGVALTNAGDTAAEVILTGLTGVGIQFADDPATTDVVEYVNPRTFSLAPGQQVAQTNEELVQSGKEPYVEGWFDLDSDQPGLRSFFLTGDRLLKRMDGTVATQLTTRRLIVPEVRVTEGMVTELSVLNPNRQTGDYAVALVGSDGLVKGTFTRQVPSRSYYAVPVRDPNPSDDVANFMFPETVFENWEDGYLIVATDTGVNALARYYDSERMSTLLGTPITARDPSYARLVVPQVALFGGAVTHVKLVNSNPRKQNEQDTVTEIPITVTLRLRDDEGADLASPVTLEMGAGIALRHNLADLFELEDPGTAIGAWLDVTSDPVGVVASVQLELFSGKAMTSLPLGGDWSEELVFSHVAQGMGLSTGLALVNPGETAAAVTIEVYAADGELVATRTSQIEGGGRLTGLLGELFPGFPQQLGGHVRVQSDQPLSGTEIFFADSLEFVAVVGAQ